MDRQVGEILAALAEQGLADDTIVIWTSDHGDGLPRAKRELYDSGLQVPMIVYWPERWRPAHITPGTSDPRLLSFVDLAPTILALAHAPVPAYLQGADFLAADTPPRNYIHAARDRHDEVMDRQRAVRDERFKYIRSWYPQVAGGHLLAFRDNQAMMRDMRAMWQAGKLNADQARWFEPVSAERLYDLAEDPFELHDLSDDPLRKADLNACAANSIDGCAK
jgi:arylsulfatase A-like enzyme